MVDLQSLPAQESRPQTLSVLWVIKDPSTSSSPRSLSARKMPSVALTPICLPSYSLCFPGSLRPPALSFQERLQRQELGLGPGDVAGRRHHQDLRPQLHPVKADGALVLNPPRASHRETLP